MSPQSDIQARTLYEQVKDEFVRRVVTKEWKPGELLKSEADLARELRVSLGTVRKAFDCLTDMQLFTRFPGKGTTVVDQVSLKTNHRFINTRDADGKPVLGELIVSNAHLVEATGDLARAFDVLDKTNLIKFDRIRVYRDRIFTKETVHISPAKHNNLSPEQQANQLWFDRDVTIDKTEWIELSTANEELADVFEVKAGISLFGSKRIIYGYREKVLEYRVGHIHTGNDLQFMLGLPRP